ncbi:MAG TPA: amidohydrolase family protein, partial [bacterium]|nr:amidohydrolase family protein [bacterium]
MKRKSLLREEFYKQGYLSDTPVYDLHGHMGPVAGIHLPFCEPEAMVQRMKTSGVRKLVFSHHAALMAPDIGNRASQESVERYPDFLRAYLAFNPHYPGVFHRETDGWETGKKFFVGLKLLSDYHRVCLSDERYRLAWEFADSLRLPVLLHTWGGSGYDGPEQVRLVAGRYQQCQILLGHSCHGDWQEAMALVKDFPHVYLELCAVLDERGILEEMVRRVGSERIIFGTDFP